MILGQDVRAVPRRGEQVGEYESIPSRYRGSEYIIPFAGSLHFGARSPRTSQRILICGSFEGVNGGRRRTHLMDPDRTLTEGPAPLTEDPAQTELRMRRQQQQHNDLKGGFSTPLPHPFFSLLRSFLQPNPSWWHPPAKETKTNVFLEHSNKPSSAEIANPNWM